METGKEDGLMALTEQVGDFGSLTGTAWRRHGTHSQPN